jgi:hypothetical protein
MLALIADALLPAVTLDHHLPLTSCGGVGNYSSRAILRANQPLASKKRPIR